MAASTKEESNGDRCYNKITLYFLLVLGIIAVSLWTLFLIQLTQITQETKFSQQQHITGSLEARNVVLEAKELAKYNVNMTKINAKNIKNILGNITDMNEKLDHQIIIINKQQQQLMENLTK